jgi:CRP-like cAMP-binding protein
VIDPFLAKLNARRRLAAAEVDVLLASFGRIRTFRAGEELVRQGSHPKDSTLLLEGFAARVVTLERGAQQITELQVPGDMVDLHSYLLRTMDHSVVALTAGSLALLPHERLDVITTTQPELTRTLWLMTLIDSAIHRQWIASLGRRDGVGRLAYLLCELYVRLAVVGLAADGAFELPLTQGQLADVLGRHRGSVNEDIGALRSRALLQWSRGRLRILDWPGLAAAADFDAAYLQLEHPPV